MQDRTQMCGAGHAAPAAPQCKSSQVKPCTAAGQQGASQNGTGLRRPCVHLAPRPWTANCARVRRDPGCKAHKHMLRHTSQQLLLPTSAPTCQKSGPSSCGATGVASSRQPASGAARLCAQAGSAASPAFCGGLGGGGKGGQGGGGWRCGRELAQKPGPGASGSGWPDGRRGHRRRAAALGLLTCSRRSRLFSVSTGIRLTSEPAGGGGAAVRRPAGGAQRWPRSRAEEPTLLPSHSCRPKRSPVGYGRAGYAQAPARLSASRGHSGRAAWGL